MKRVESSPGSTPTDARRTRFGLLTSSKVKSAFDISKRTAPDRALWRSLFGNSSLIARRLVESACFVNVTWDLFWDRGQVDYDAWDTHARNTPILKENNCQLRPDPTARWEDWNFAACWMRRGGGGDERDGPPEGECSGSAITGRIATPCCWPAPASAAAPSTALGCPGGLRQACRWHRRHLRTIYQCLGIDPTCRLRRSRPPTAVANGGGDSEVLA